MRLLLLQAWAVGLKEAKILLRDPGGLVLLFVLPAIFVLVLSISLQGAFSTPEHRDPMRILVVDEDRGEASRRIVKALEDTGSFHVVMESQPAGGGMAADGAIERGRYRIAVRVPAGSTADLARETDLAVEISVDPAVPAEFVSSVRYTVEAAVLEARGEKLRAESDRLADGMDSLEERIGKLRDRMESLRGAVDSLEESLDDCAEANERLAGKLAEIRAAMPPGHGQPPPGQPAPQAGWKKPEIARPDDLEDGDQGIDVSRPSIDMDSGLGVTLGFTGGGGRKVFPNSVQQNVPGWTIFALFWIAQIIALSMISERTSGAWTRIMASPVPAVAIVAGKVVPFVAINLVQAVFMFAIGLLVLPLAGCPRMSLGDPLGLAIVTLATSLAAVGLGFLMSSLSRVSMMVAAGIVVVLIVMAVLGGIMVPKFLMPEVMQQMSMLVPQGWALEGYLDILVRGRKAVDVLPCAAVLTGFAVAFFLAAMLRMRRMGRSG